MGRGSAWCRRSFPDRLLFVLLAVCGCSIYAPDHVFRSVRPHSNDPGSCREDTSAVVAILEANGLPPDSFDAVVGTDEAWRVHSLDLSGRGITTIPEAIGDLGALRRLDIAENSLSTLPQAIVKLVLIDSVEYCSGPCGGADCCTTYPVNGLVLHHNRLCSLSPEIHQWVDRHFEKTNYLTTDSTQDCP